MKESIFDKINIFLLGLLYIGIGSKFIFTVLYNLDKLYAKSRHLMPINSYKNIYGVCFLIIAVLLISCGIGILFHKKWSRKIALFISYLVGAGFILKILHIWLRDKFQGIPNPIVLCYFILLVVFPIYCLTRPKVKEQFK